MAAPQCSEGTGWRHGHPRVNVTALEIAVPGSDNAFYRPRAPGFNFSSKKFAIMW